ncbi:hypothetical protein, conserved [Leishmania tarentolae]|uniref:CSD domain-containing protein n=1 Tax=Leishmania tarentolae TaxID=5689 RepID=A0A640KC05_LEITA|nr:hypothetical protein, conserved [Leishmania tarentolae]
MPAKLTSKNIFDVVFDDLPADAFIDTGPASLKEELILEAAGMLESSAQRGGTKTIQNSSSGGGMTSYRRHLLPSAFVAATAAIVRSIGRSAPTAPKDSAATAVTTPAVQSDALQDTDVLDTEVLEDDTSSSAWAQALPPGYASATPHTAEVWSSSVCRSVDDDMDGHCADHFRVMHGDIHIAQKRRDRGRDAAETESDFDMQMDAEDDAVKEATKYAGCLAELQATEDAPTEGDKVVSGKWIGADDGRSNLRGDRPVGKNTFGGTRRAVGAFGKVTESSVRLDATCKGTVAAPATSTTGQSTVVSKTTQMGPAGASSVTVSGAESRRGEGQISNRAPPSYAAEGPHGGSAGHTTTNVGDPGSAAGGQLLQRPLGFISTQQRGGTLTAAEQLALMPPGLDRVYTGVCVMYRHSKNFGFISPDVGGPDVFFINDSIALSFTRLALRAFYLRSGMPVPPSVAVAYRVGDTTKGLAAPGRDAVLTDGGTAALENGSTIANDERRPPDDTLVSTSAFHEVTAGVAAVSDGETTKASAVLGQEGVLGATSVLTTRAGDAVDRVSIPFTTAEELAWAETAASMLTSATARLLQYQVDQGIGGGLRVGDPMSFVVTRNHAARGGNGRLLRAEFIRGVPAAQLAIPVEQSWFYPLFPGAIGYKTSALYGASSKAPLPSPAPSSSAEDGGREASSNVEREAHNDSASSTLTRYTGCVRTYDAEEQRGYIRCDESDSSGGSNTPDVIFYAYSVLWDLTQCPPQKRQVKESMRLAYSVCGTERNGKYIATLITTPDGEPFWEENMTFAENVLPFFMADVGGPSRRRGRGEDSGGVAGGRSVMGTGGGTTASTESVGGDRKHHKAEEDDMLLLYAEDDYPLM